MDGIRKHQDWWRYSGMILLSCSVFPHLSFLVAVKVCTFEFEHAVFYRKFQFVNCLRLSKRECMFSFKNNKDLYGKCA